MISFRIDYFDLAVQGTLKSLLQHHNSKPSILQPSAFFMVQLSHPFVTTGKTMALTMDLCWQSDVSAFRFVIAFFPRSKHFLISWLQSPFTVILESKKMKSDTVSMFSPSTCHEVMGLDVNNILQ